MNRQDWIEAGGFLSCTALLAGLGVSLVIPGLEWAAFWWRIPALYVVSLIPGAVSILAAHFHDWSNPL